MLLAFLDTCVLLKSYLCDTLLSIAEAGVYRPLWSPTVMTELERNLARRGLGEKEVAHRLDQMNWAFPDALVVGYETMISDMANERKTCTCWPPPFVAVLRYWSPRTSATSR